MATDWREAGHRADAKRVLNLYRRSFDNAPKRIARERSIEALVAAGVRTVIVLWGGGLDAEACVAAGLRVIAVDNGSMALSDEAGRLVSTERKRRALMYAAQAGGYEWRWGDVRRFLSEADGALLDFHGPWARDKRLTINAAQHMTAVVVVLVPSRDLSEASSADEREIIYQAVLKFAWADRPKWEAVTAGGHVRRLTDYHEDQGRHVFVYLLGRKHVKLSVMKHSDRVKMRRDKRDRVRANARAYYHRLDEAGKAAYNAKVRHNDHMRSGVLPTKACPVCGALRERRCEVCSSSIETAGRVAKYCSDPCRRIAHSRQNRVRLAAVSGTAAEAISSEEAA